MKLTPRPRTKTNDVHLRIAKHKRDLLDKLCVVKNITITQLFEKHIEDLAQHHKII